MRTDMVSNIGGFLSTLSLRRATHFGFLWPSRVRYFYPRSPCGERLQLVRYLVKPFCISIHALLAESDAGPVRLWKRGYISIHALLAESDRLSPGDDVSQDISIHALLAESDIRCEREFLFINISIHALLAESDKFNNGMTTAWEPFLSTLSLRRATFQTFHFILVKSISIHALLAESDNFAMCCVVVLLYFYPRSPCGERHRTFKTRKAGCNISIHALLAESDDYNKSMLLHLNIFLSTLSLRRATKRYFTYFIGRLLFLSTLSLRRATGAGVGLYLVTEISIHALLAESDL